jgi:hypothetical protein
VTRPIRPARSDSIRRPSLMARLPEPQTQPRAAVHPVHLVLARVDSSRLDSTRLDCAVCSLALAGRAGWMAGSAAFRPPPHGPAAAARRAAHIAPPSGWIAVSVGQQSCGPMGTAGGRLPLGGLDLWPNKRKKNSQQPLGQRGERATVSPRKVSVLCRVECGDGCSESQPLVLGVPLCHRRIGRGRSGPVVQWPPTASVCLCVCVCAAAAQPPLVR